MTVNKHAGVRAGLCWTKEIAYLTSHNDANVVSIPARFTSIEQAIEIDTFGTLNLKVVDIKIE
jgi:ribose 5-phosphate isomerase B